MIHRAEVELDRNGLEVLDREVCLDLLETVPIGRMGLSLDALPVVLPVNFMVAQPPTGGDPIVVIRSAAGSKLTAALDRNVVAFEVDGYDALTHSGWSVLVQGVTRVLAGAERAWAQTLPVQPWAIDGTAMFIGLDTDVVRGRRFGAGRALHPHRG
jgi:uncharacterized protein